MKKTTMVLSTLVLGGSLFGGNIIASAAEYDDATHAKTDAKINFTADTGPTLPVDPVDPPNPIDPVDPPNPNGAELMITYASNINFGSQSKDGTSWNALADVWNAPSGSGTIEGTPMVAIKDSRGSDRRGWSLTVKQNEAFKDTAGNSLTGAELTFKNLFYATGTAAPTANTSDVILNDAAQEIASADETTGIGQWSLGLGQLTGDEGSKTTDGITLSVPSTTAKNTTTYKTTLTYELTADPSL